MLHQVGFDSVGLEQSSLGMPPVKTRTAPAPVLIPDHTFGTCRDSLSISALLSLHKTISPLHYLPIGLGRMRWP
jgi:hypothetical protein